MNIAAIFSGFVAKLSAPRSAVPRATDGRRAIIAKLRAAQARHHTQEIHRCRKALRAAVNAELRNSIKGN